MFSSLMDYFHSLTNEYESSSLKCFALWQFSYYMKLRILYHGNCFDGVSSAAIFTKFYRAKVASDAEVAYTPTMHRAGNAFDREQFDGDENAIVDFKNCPDER